MKIERYQAYKKCDIEWLLEIPEHWKIDRAKSLFREMSRPVLPSDKIITVFRDGQVTLRENRRVTGFTNAIEEYGYQGIRKGDLVFHAMDAFAGAIGVSDSDGKATPEYLVYTTIDKNKIYIPFFGFLLRQMALSGFVLALGKSVRERSPRFKHTKFVTLELPIPPLPEQKTIAHYLDTKTAQIDRKIDLLTQKATLYSNLKQSLINETVTRGLDKSVPMKDSGIEWIGEVPEHWEVRRIKDFSSVVRGGSPRPAGDLKFYEGDIPFLKVGDLTSNEELYLSTYTHTIKKAGLTNTRFIPRNTLLLTNSGATLGIPKICIFPTTFNDGIAAFIHLKNINQVFLFYFLKNRTKWYLNQASLGQGQPNLNTEIIGNTFIACPPLSEQKAIADYLDTKTAKIDQIIQTINTQIEKLKELRKTLINDVVTGKIKV